MKKNMSTTLNKELLTAYTNNALTTKGKLLVLFLFNNEKEMRLTRMHPESWQVSMNLDICSYICDNVRSKIFCNFVGLVCLCPYLLLY